MRLFVVPSWLENIELRAKKAIKWGLPHFVWWPRPERTHNTLKTRRDFAAELLEKYRGQKSRNHLR
jgi:hypothetical protein